LGWGRRESGRRLFETLKNGWRKHSASHFNFVLKQCLQEALCGAESSRSKGKLHPQKQKWYALSLQARAYQLFGYSFPCWIEAAPL
jgi:hypothetical protein